MVGSQPALSGSQFQGFASASAGGGQAVPFTSLYTATGVNSKSGPCGVTLRLLDVIISGAHPYYLSQLACRNWYTLLDYYVGYTGGLYSLASRLSASTSAIRVYTGGGQTCALCYNINYALPTPTPWGF